jgi:ribose/xylose/arabinose/galactoside ABC-type transport system permease subunit
MTYPEERGFRVEPEFRQASGSPEVPKREPIEVHYQEHPIPQPALPASQALPSSQALPQTAPLALPAPRAVTAAELDGAFDDPDHGEPGRDRFGVHVLWEVVLLLVGAGLAFLVTNTDGGSLSGVHLRTILAAATVLGLLGLAAGLSLRAGAVNLAIGPQMVLAGLFFAQHEHSGYYGSATGALGLAAACGLGIALVVTLFHVPGWAASLGAYFGILIWCTHLPETATLANRYQVVHEAYYWFGAVAALALIGSILGAIPPIRRGVGRLRPISDPADRRGTSAGVITGLALIGSSLLAGLAGITLTMIVGSMTTGDGLSYTGIGIAIALLGGTSAYGRRGGILGTLAATAVVELAIDNVTLRHWRGGEITVIAVALGIGVLVTRMVEAYGRPRHTPLLDDPTVSWLGRQQGSWADQQALPAGPAETTLFDAAGDRWGAR